MCADPVTLMMVGSAVSAGGQVFGAISGNKAANASASAMEAQAALRIQKGEYEAEESRRRFVRENGTAVASAARSGSSLESFADVFADDASEAALERASIRYGAQVDAANLRRNASVTRSQGRDQLIGGLAGAAGTLLSGFGRAGRVDAHRTASTSMSPY